MEFRKFGSTDLKVSTIGFGAWGIGGPAMAGDIPIGWGKVDDKTSTLALKKSLDRGINFYDTANFYGLGHSEELLGKGFGNRQDVIIASKVGHRLDENQSIYLDYSKKHIIEACEQSLKRLKRDVIDYHQLHTAKVLDFENGECIEAMEQLKKEGKIRYWGVSLNTFNPEPEADYLLENNLGDGLQIVFNIINQKAKHIIDKSLELSKGIIARMPLQFGLLTGKFDADSKFPQDDHRAFRFNKEILKKSLLALEDIWDTTSDYNLSKTSLSLSFITSYRGVSTVIPGIKTEQQALDNTTDITQLNEETMHYILNKYENDFMPIVDLMKKQG